MRGESVVDIKGFGKVNGFLVREFPRISANFFLGLLVVYLMLAGFGVVDGAGGSEATGEIAVLEGELNESGFGWLVDYELRREVNG